MNKRITATYSGIVFLVLLLFAVIYVKERVIYTDAANYVFFIIQTKSFNIANYRFIAVLFEFPAVAAVQNNFSLISVLQAYSLGYFIIDIIVWLFLFFILKDYAKSLAVVLIWLLSNNFDFYFPVSELYKALFLLILLWAIVEKWVVGNQKITPGSLLLLAFLSVTILWSHPMILFCFLFLVLYLFAKHRQNASSKWILILAILMVLEMTVKLLYFNPGYENDKYKEAQKCIELFPDYFNTIQARSYWNYLINENFVFGIVVLINITLLIIRRKWLILTGYVLFCVGIWILVSSSYNDRAYDYYIENLYKPTIFFTIVVFTDEFIITVQEKKYIYIGLILIATFSLAKIRHARHVFQYKLQKIDTTLQIMNKNNIDKAYFHTSKFGKMINDDRWNMVVESLLYSACEDAKNTKTFEVTYNTDDVKNLVQTDSSVFYQLNMKTPSRSLNQHYFILPNTRYVKIDSLINIR